MCIILLGIKHCGKSTQARLLSQKLSLPSYDTDDVITELTSKTPREIYTGQGQEAFKQAELQACRHLAQTIAASGTDAVIATGGGICANPSALEALHALGKFVFLHAPEEMAADRIVREIKEDENGEMANLPAYIAKKSPHSLLEVRAIFHEFYVERVKTYSKLADISVEMGRDSKEENCLKILGSLKLHSA